MDTSIEDKCIFWMMHDIIDYYYSKIILKKDLIEPSIVQDLNDKTKKNKTKLMNKLSTILDCANSIDVNISYCGIYCRRHLKIINSKFDLKFTDYKSLYIFLSDYCIICNNGYKKLICIHSIYKQLYMLDVFKANKSFKCSECNEILEKYKDEKYSFVDSSFCVCVIKSSILCHNCILKD